jgi:hypothetical protein
VYFNGATQRTYQVEAIHYGNDARRALGRATCDWAITIRDIDDDEEWADNPRVDYTAWDPTRDYVICDPAR